MAKTLTDLFHDQLRDAYSAETQIAAALPKMARAATSPDLRAGFETHLRETEAHVTRLEQVCGLVGCDPEGNTCEATEGLLEEGDEVLGLGLDADAQDAGLIAAAQKVEHYEMALYGTLCMFAKRLGHGDAARVLHQTLEEERATDQKLTALAERGINQRATA